MEDGAIADGFSNTVAEGKNNAASSGFLGGATISGGESNQTFSSYATVSGGFSNNASNDYASVGGGLDNIGSGAYSFVGGGQNNSVGEYGFIGGGKFNRALDDGSDYGVVGGGMSNLIVDNYGTISGGIDNFVGSFDSDPTIDTYATIGGGASNTASGPSATIGGGSSNTASDVGATIGGGQQNEATFQMSTVGGGIANGATDFSSIVGGGNTNTASADYATVGGGVLNTASGESATIPGGKSNSATGAYSFAAGRRAKATHDGAFVWADNINADFFSTAVNQFNILAQGGTRIFTNNTLTAGVLLAAGGNGWSAVSDVAYKQNFALVDARSILEKLSEMPVGQYNLASQDPSIQHMGPTAQDFRKAFGLGESETLINSLDSDGVALAAIQGLYEMMQEKDAEIAELKEAVGLGPATDDGGSLGVTQLLTRALMGGLLMVGVILVAHLRRYNRSNGKSH